MVSRETDTRRNVPEAMGEFFDRRADGYEEHMRGNIAGFEGFYAAVEGQVPETGGKVEVLDLGCGTGLELAGVFRRAPRAQVTGIDLSQRMLDILRRSYAERANQIRLIQGSYLTVPLPEGRFDCAISVQTMHHLLPEPKVELYRRICRALRPGGRYVEGDYVVSPEEDESLLQAYRERMNGPGDGRYHIDVPFSVPTQKRLLIEAGFTTVEVVYHQHSAAVLVATKGPPGEDSEP